MTATITYTDGRTLPDSKWESLAGVHRQGGVLHASGVKIRTSAARWLSARPASRSVGQDRAPPWRALCASKGTRFWAFGLPQPVTGSQPGPAR
jgi:hypothetical protein